MNSNFPNYNMNMMMQQLAANRPILPGQPMPVQPMERRPSISTQQHQFEMQVQFQMMMNVATEMGRVEERKRQADQARLAEQARQLEQARIFEQARLQEIARQEQQAKLAIENAKKEAEVKAQEMARKMMQQAMQAEQAQKMEEARKNQALKEQLEFSQSMYQDLLTRHIMMSQQKQTVAIVPCVTSPTIMASPVSSLPSPCIIDQGFCEPNTPVLQIPPALLQQLLAASNPIITTSPVMDHPVVPMHSLGKRRNTDRQIKEEPGCMYAITPEPSPKEIKTEPVDCSSPSTSTSMPSLAKESEEDTDPELFLDVENVDARTEGGKDRRRQHIEFYRKVKGIRNFFKNQPVSCMLCDEKSANNDNDIASHVNKHAKAGCYWCKLCGWETPEKYKIYGHMRREHPKNLDFFEDRRDMKKLCVVIHECFPRNSNMKKSSNDTNTMSNFTKYLEDSNVKEMNCALCDAIVPRPNMLKHARTHHVYRCKECKYTTDTLDAQKEHQLTNHNSSDPQLMVDFNVCQASDVIARTFLRCFNPSTVSQ